MTIAFPVKRLRSALSLHQSLVQELIDENALLKASRNNWANECNRLMTENAELRLSNVCE